MASEGKESHFSELRILFFGMSGILSRVPLTLLLNAGANVCGLVLPAAILPPYVLPEDGRYSFIIPQSNQLHAIKLTPNPGILEVAAQQQLPVYPVGRLREEDTLEMITAVAPDLICVSCFNQILPPALLQIPKYGCLNLHPSWLPQFRGPSPLFWQLQAGQSELGVTVHFMDEGLDSGDIALQVKLALRDGLSGAQIEQMCAERGGRLLLQAIERLAKDDLPRQPQTSAASYQPTPTNADFHLKPDWTAQRAFNFMRGTQEYARPYHLQIAGKKLWLSTAVAYHPNATQAQPIQLSEAQTVAVQFSDGVLIAHTINKIR